MPSSTPRRINAFCSRVFSLMRSRSSETARTSPCGLFSACEREKSGQTTERRAIKASPRARLQSRRRRLGRVLLTASKRYCRCECNGRCATPHVLRRVSSVSSTTRLLARNLPASTTRKLRDTRASCRYLVPLVPDLSPCEARPACLATGSFHRLLD